MVQTGSPEVFLRNRSIAVGIVDCATRTKFTETDRDSDETVLMRIVNIVELILTKGSVDKARVALGLQCVQTIWIQDTHSAALRDCARQAVFRILVHVMTLPGGCDGYASTLLDNVCLNIELLAKQPPATFDADKLSFFVDVVGVVSRLPATRQWASEMVPYQLMHALFYLVPPAAAAQAADGNSTCILLRNSSALPIAASLLSIGNAAVRRILTDKSQPASALAVEALLVAMYCRGLCPLTDASEAAKLTGLGDVALQLMAAKRAVPASAAPNGYINMSAPGLTGQAPVVQQIQAMLLESLAQLVKEPHFAAVVWESFDCVWHRTEVASMLVDGVVSMALSQRVIALIPPAETGAESPSHHDRDRVLKALSAFHALAASPESTIDPDALIPSYIECLSIGILKDLMVSLHNSLGCEAGADQTPNQFLVRHSSKEVSKQIKTKPKKANEIVGHFLHEFSRELHPPASGGTAWALRVIPSIDFETLGEFFGQPGEASAKALSDFIKSLNLAAMDPEEALRACLQSFRLPGEAQQIDRIIKEIAYEYYNSHSDLTVAGNYFASADAAYTFLFSVIMLNTDQHNPQVKKRMELKDFLRNNRKINEGQDIPEDVQARVFNSIRNSQIATPKSGSYFCCPLKGRWKDLWHLNQVGYVPSKLRSPGRHSVHRFLGAKGYDVLIASAYVLARDPKRYTKSVEVVAGLAELALGPGSVDPIVKSLGADCVALLRKYAIKSFATAISNISPTPRSFDCLAALLRLQTGTADALLEAVSSLLCYWSAYALLLPEGALPPCPADWQTVLQMPVLDTGSATAGGGAISNMFRGFLTPLYEQDGRVAAANQAAEHEEHGLSLFSQDTDDSRHPTETEGGEGKTRRSSLSSLDSLVSGNDWRQEVLRTSFADGSPNSPSGHQLLALEAVEVDKFLAAAVENGSKASGIVLMMFELVSAAGKSGSDDFWSKELVRSSPWALLLATRLLGASKHSDLLASSTARDAVVSVIRSYITGHLTDVRGLKISIFVAFALVVLFAQRDPLSNVVDPAWILPVLDEISSLATDNPVVTSIGPLVCMAVRLMVSEAPEAWLARLGSPVWRECVKLVAAVCPKSKTPDAETGKRICHETALFLILNSHFLNSFGAAANGTNDMNDCVVAFESILHARASQRIVSKSLAELACKLAACPQEGTGLAWSCVVARVTVRVSAVAKQKRPTGPELSDSVELLRICLGHPRATQILTPLQAGSTIEKCASSLSAVVSANTPPGALQAALCVFARFFLTCLDRLQQHPQFDHLWLMSLRVVLLFIKRGHDDPSMEQLAEVTTETLRNALQVLVAGGLLQLPRGEAANPDDPMWWKVTWEIVETFCPGMWTELSGDSHEKSDVKLAPVVADKAAVDGGAEVASDESVPSDQTPPEPESVTPDSESVGEDMVVVDSAGTAKRSAVAPAPQVDQE